MSIILPFDTETTGLPVCGEPSGGDNQPHIVQLGAILLSDSYEVLFSGIETIKSWADFEGCLLSFGGLRLRGEAKKFEFKPRGDLITEVTFVLSVLNPNKGDVNVLAEMVQEDAACELEFPSDLFDGASDAEECLDQALNDQDDLYDEAVGFVRKEKRASISAIQRRLKIGYNRAAILIEEMERNGVVSEMGPDGTREVMAEVA